MHLVKSKQYSFFLVFFFHSEKMAQGCEIGNIPTWEKINYKLQTKKIFPIMRGLSNRGLNPKTHITSIHVTTIDIMEVFREFKVLRTM